MFSARNGVGTSQRSDLAFSAAIIADCKHDFGIEIELL